MLIERILAAYGISNAVLLPMQKGYRNESHAAILTTGERVNVIIYKREAGILTTLRRANLVGDYIAAQGLPSRLTHDPRILRLQANNSTTYAALYEYLPGHTIPWEAYTMVHLKHLGATMSSMHELLKVAPFTLDRPVTDEYLATTTRMQHYFAELGVQRALEAKLGLKVAVPERFTKLLAGCAKLPDQQVLHMDFVRGNILFDDAAEITGILDFEKAAWGHPLFDIARTLAFLLVDCKYKTEAQVRKYFLASGYNKHGTGEFKVAASNSRLLEQLVDLFLLYDLYKFFRHNPYESLADNEHYARTEALLLQRKIIARVHPRASNMVQ